MSTVTRLAAARCILDANDGGVGYLNGDAALQGPPLTPVWRRVRLFAEPGARPIRETWSDAAGQWRFDWIDPGRRYTVIAYDHTGTYDPVAKTGLVPSKMPGY